jgi:hypothetical protein
VGKDRGVISSIGLCIAIAFGFLFVWELIGMVVISAIDTPDMKIFKWASSSPIPGGYHLTLIAWPVVVWAAWKYPVK